MSLFSFQILFIGAFFTHCFLFFFPESTVYFVGLFKNPTFGFVHQLYFLVYVHFSKLNCFYVNLLGLQLYPTCYLLHLMNFYFLCVYTNTHAHILHYMYYIVCM